MVVGTSINLLLFAWVRLKIVDCDLLAEGIWSRAAKEPDNDYTCLSIGVEDKKT